MFNTAAVGFMLDAYGRKNTISFMFACCGIALLLLKSGFFPLTLLLCVIKASSQAFREVSRFHSDPFSLKSKALWIYASEVFPTSHRTTGLGFVISFSRVGNIASLFLAYVVFAASSSLTLWLCFFFCAIVCTCLMFSFPMIRLFSLCDRSLKRRIKCVCKTDRLFRLVL